MKPKNNDWGRRLLRLMLRRGMRQSELARRAGMPRNNVSTYVNGRSYPTPLNLQRLALALGVGVGEIALPIEVAVAGTTDQLDRIEQLLIAVHIKLGIGVFG